MSEIPNQLKYTREHEWISVSGDLAKVGITDHAQEQLGDIVFVEVPDVGGAVEAGGTFGVVESIKSVSDLFAPVSGEVLRFNEELEERPELLNSDPYENWIIEMKIRDPSELGKLLDAGEYGGLLENGGEGA